MVNRRIFWLITFVVLLLFAAAFYYWAGQPISVKPVSRGLTTEETVTVGSTVLRSQYYTATITDIYTPQHQNDTPEGPILSSLTAVQGSHKGGQLAITIAKLPAGGITEAADVRVRRDRSESYQQVELDAAPSGALVFRSKQTYEVGVFWVYGDSYVSAVLSSNNVDPGQYDKQLSALLSSWRWLP